MTDLIERLARQAGQTQRLVGVGRVFTDEQLQRFAALVAEECQLVARETRADAYSAPHAQDPAYRAGYQAAADLCERRIRAKFKESPPPSEG